MLSFLRDLKIRTKLMATFTLILFFVGSVGWVAYHGMTLIEHNLNGLFSVSLPSIDLLIEADRDLQQLLVAERSMISADPQSKIFTSLQKDYDKNLKQVSERFGKFQQLVNSPEEKALIASFERDRSAWEPISRQVVEKTTSGNTEARKAAMDLSLGKGSELFETARGNLDKLTEISLQNAEKAQQEAEAVYRRALITLLVILVVACVVAACSAIVLGVAIANPVRAAVLGLQDIAQGEGDLTKRLTVRSRDEIGELATWLNVFMEKLQGIIGQISRNTQALDSSSHGLTCPETAPKSIRAQQTSPVWPGNSTPWFVGSRSDRRVSFPIYLQPLGGLLARAGLFVVWREQKPFVRSLDQGIRSFWVLGFSNQTFALCT